VEEASALLPNTVLAPAAPIHPRNLLRVNDMSLPLLMRIPNKTNKNQKFERTAFLNIRDF
jgi:hypothetical protein